MNQFRFISSKHYEKNPSETFEICRCIIKRFGDNEPKTSSLIFDTQINEPVFQNELPRCTQREREREREKKEDDTK